MARDFLRASRARQRRRSWQQRVTVAGLSALLVIAGGAAWAANRAGDAAARFSDAAATQQAQALTNHLIAEAGDQSTADQTLAAQLALLAYRRAPSEDVRTRLISTEGTPWRPR